MTIRDYLQVLREQVLVIVLAILLGLAGALTAFYLRPAQYTASLTMYVSAQSSDTAAAAFQGAQLSQDRVVSYTELLTSARVVSGVIDDLHLNESVSSLESKITATSKPDSVLLDVSVSDSSAQRATDIVNAIGTIFPSLVSELERPSIPGGTPAVAVRVVQPAAVPTEPSSAGLPTNIALGLLAGIAVGIGAALARNAVDTSVRSLERLKEATAAPNLGSIAHDPLVPSRPLTVHEDPQSPRSEAFRQLRTNLQFIDVDQPRKVVVVTSAMPAEGKTTTVANLAISLSSAGGRVLVIEADLRRPKISELLGLERTAGLTTVLSGRVEANQVIQSWGGGIFDVLASGPIPPNPSELLASKHMERLLEELRKQYDTILVDSPPLLPVTDAAAVAPASDGVLLVCRFNQTTYHQVESAVAALGAVSAPLLGTVFTMVPNSGPRAYSQYNSYYHADQSIEEQTRDGRDLNPQNDPSVDGYVQQRISRPTPRRRG